MNRKLKEVLSTSLYLLVVLALTFLVITFVGQRTKVIGSSMEPMLKDGDNLTSLSVLILLCFLSGTRKEPTISNGLSACPGKLSILMKMA